MRAYPRNIFTTIGVLLIIAACAKPNPKVESSEAKTEPIIKPTVAPVVNNSKIERLDEMQMMQKEMQKVLMSINDKLED